MINSARYNHHYRELDLINEGPPQHDDHIWLTVDGEAWAIMAINRFPPDVVVFYLWRGYQPNLDYRVVECTNYDWAGYCEAAVRKLVVKK
jgi:hypothetical protein